MAADEGDDSAQPSEIRARAIFERLRRNAEAAGQQPGASPLTETRGPAPEPPGAEPVDKAQAAQGADAREDRFGAEPGLGTSPAERTAATEAPPDVDDMVERQAGVVVGDPDGPAVRGDDTMGQAAPGQDADRSSDHPDPPAGGSAASSVTEEVADIIVRAAFGVVPAMEGGGQAAVMADHRVLAGGEPSAAAAASTFTPPAPAAEATRETGARLVAQPLPAPGLDDGHALGFTGSAGDPTASSFARPLPRVMAIANQKGGVGKTTTAVNLGACLAILDYRVLVCDMDPQGNASTGLGLNPRTLATSMYDVVLNDLPIRDCIEPSSVRNLFVAPASLDLAGAEIELVPAFSRELRLKRALEAVREDFDFVLIDCPPSLGLLTVNGLAAATEVVVPIQCEYYALEGLGQLLRNVTLVQRNLNPSLEVSAIVLVMYDGRTKLSDQVVQEVRRHFGEKVCRHIVPRTVRLSEAPSFGQPIIAFDPTSRGAIAYRELAKEISGGTPQRAR